MLLNSVVLRPESVYNYDWIQMKIVIYQCTGPLSDTDNYQWISPFIIIELYYGLYYKVSYRCDL